MNIFSFLISFVFVRVSTYSLKNYIKDVVITNAHIKLAYNMNNITTKDNVVAANGLEHVLKKIIEKTDYDLGMMNNMIAIPEYQYLNSWIECKGSQATLRLEIQNELDLRSLYLTELGEERRKFTQTALKNILNRTINYGDPENVTKLIQERTIHGTDALENRFFRALAGPEKEISLLWTCSLIALFMNTKFPRFYIKEIETNSNDTSCIMIYNDYSIKKTYSKIEGEWCEVIVNELGNEEAQPLKEQLL
ncbi:uncharacterized protein LOC126833965 isoform X2 [Adelges cooleyi]|uniref:uncharacterized protein LOC126833965 isoform X2 n=1 Tax=Adelges cooleyi TaxID=133065 RepID=UPI00218010AC|nr:uncharacterized protein LOC126833965 isoform X2 [Adelges cooleyi]